MIRSIKGTDIPALIELWNKALPDHPIDRRTLVKNVLLDMNFEKEGFLVAESAGELLGFVWAIARKYPVDVGAPSDEDKGYINLIALRDKSDINGELGKTLLRAGEEYVYSKGKNKITVSGYTPNYFYPGINVNHREYLSLFLGEGYSELKRNHSICIDLSDFSVSEEILELKRKREEEGFVFTPLCDEYVTELVSYHLPGWAHRFRRLVNETMDYDKVRLVVHGEKIVGVCVFGDPYSTEERFGPYGINQDYRGLGLGKILLSDTLAEMKKRGLNRAWAQSTPVSGAAFFLYQKAGFKIVNTYATLIKEK